MINAKKSELHSARLHNSATRTVRDAVMLLRDVRSFCGYEKIWELMTTEKTR